MCWLKKNLSYSNSSYKAGSLGSSKLAITLSKQVESDINNGSVKELPKPLYLEAEAPRYRQLQLAKKAYIYWNIDNRELIRDPTTGEKTKNPRYGEPIPFEEKDAISCKGIVLVRRNYCEWHKSCYRQIAYNVIKGESMESSLAVIIETVENLMNDIN